MGRTSMCEMLHKVRKDKRCGHICTILTLSVGRRWILFVPNAFQRNEDCGRGVGFFVCGVTKYASLVALADFVTRSNSTWTCFRKQLAACLLGSLAWLHTASSQNHAHKVAWSRCRSQPLTNFSLHARLFLGSRSTMPIYHRCTLTNIWFACQTYNFKLLLGWAKGSA